jgi:DNA-binding MarR family transcriptional regulator
VPGRQDAVDRIAGQWAAVRPGLDLSPLLVVGRVSRLSRLLDRLLAENFARHGIEAWTYDVLATLYRSGEPHELTAGDLVRQTMVTTGAITNRIDRLEERGLVERARTGDRRKVLVRLTPAGRATVEEVVGGHLATERRALSALTDRQQAELARLLRLALLGLGDEA